MPLGTIKSLQDAWNLPLGNFFQGQDAVAQQQLMDKQSLQDLYSKSQFDAQERPRLLQQYDTMNEGRRVTNDATRENTRQTKNKNAWDEDTLQERMEAFKKEHAGKLSQAELNEAIKAGQGMQIVAEQVWANPTGNYAQRAQQTLQKYGGGPLWNPAWSKLPPDQLAMMLSQHGSGIISTIPKFQQDMAKVEAKNDSAEKIAAERATAQVKAAEVRAELSARIASAKSGAGKSPKKLEELAAALKQRAMVETDPGTRQELLTHYNEIMSDMWTLKTASVPQPKPEVSPNVAPGVLVKPPAKDNPFNKGAKPDPLGIR